jgi:hypothetical protein
MFRTISASLIACSTMAAPVWAASSQALMQAMRLPDMIDILREEGIAYGKELAVDMVPSGPTRSWQADVARIYDADQMTETLEAAFDDGLTEAERAELLAFFASDTGSAIIDLELSARRAFMEPEIEDAARETFRSMDGDETPLLTGVTGYVEANELIEFNVVSAFNSQYQFYRGLIEGGALEMDLGEALAAIWQDEEATRADTREWVYAFSLMAYGPLPEGALASYVDLSESDEGRALNRAMFTAFDAMYTEISYQLGLAIARQQTVQDL